MGTIYCLRFMKHTEKKNKTNISRTTNEGLMVSDHFTSKNKKNILIKKSLACGMLSSLGIYFTE